MLKNFKELDFINKIGVLNDIQSNKKIEYISQLFDLYNNPTGDDSIDNILEETLRNVVILNVEELTKRIKTESEKEKIFCIKTASRFKIIDAVPELLSVLDGEIKDKIRYEVLCALSEIKDERALEVFRKHIGYKDKIISTLSIGMIGYFKDEESMVKLNGIINDGESEENYKNCSVETAGAIDALASFDTNNVIMFFVKKIHHKNPTARRIIHEKITEKGVNSFPYLKKIFLGNNVDNKIMAANLIGRIGDKSGGDILFSVLDNKDEKDTNLRYAIYESFGMLRSMKGLICLSDALVEKEFLVLLAVILSLEPQANKNIINRIIELILKGDEQSVNLLKAIIQTKAGNIFKQVYLNSEQLADKLITQILESNDDQIINDFKDIINSFESDRKEEDIKKLSDISVVSSEINILAVDDSKAMLMFYRNLGSETGFNVITAEHGADALEIIKENNNFNLVITDMNMPIMDGTELTRNIRKNELLKNIPIIMATTESEKSQINIAKHSGVNHFIKKPFTISFLFETVTKYLA